MFDRHGAFEETLRKKTKTQEGTHTRKHPIAIMPTDYSKWDKYADSDDDEKPTKVAAQPAQDPALDAFYKLDRTASVKDIQDTIAKMSAATKEELLRHEKGGLLKRMMELDPNKEYSEGEIWGRSPAKPTSAVPKGAPAARSEPVPTPPPPPPTKPTTSATAAGATPAKKASIDYSKFNDSALDDIDDDERIVDITDALPAPLAAAASGSAADMRPIVGAAAAAKLTASKSAAAATRAEMLQSMGGHRMFTFVRLPADCSLPIEEQTGFELLDGDVLPQLLAPLFKSEVSLDPEVVARESAARFKEMKSIADAHSKTVKEGAKEGSDAEVASAKYDPTGGLGTPSASELDRQAKGGICEAWPLANPSDQTDWMAVKLYIDEVGALRRRERNPRAEALCAAVGQADVAIHGDAYVGRIEYFGKWHTEERNLDFRIDELSHNSPWVAQALKVKEARGDAAAQAAANGPNKKALAFASGADEQGRYTWSQTQEDVEVRVLVGIPLGPASHLKKRLKVSYGRGESLKVAVDGAAVLEIEKLFDRVAPDQCSWSLDEGKRSTALVVTLEKVDPRPWVGLELPTLTLAP